MVCLPSAWHTVLADITIFTFLDTLKNALKYYDSDIPLLLCKHSNPMFFLSSTEISWFQKFA